MYLKQINLKWACYHHCHLHGRNECRLDCGFFQTFLFLFFEFCFVLLVTVNRLLILRRLINSSIDWLVQIRSQPNRFASYIEVRIEFPYLIDA